MPISISKDRIRERALSLGFDAIGFTTPNASGQAAERLREFLALGRHGDMGWLAEKADRRVAPAALWPEARGVIMLAMSYAPPDDPLAVLQRPDRGAISVYARGRDYHEVVKGRLKQLGQWLAHAAGAEIKVFVDTAPVLEKPLAQAAGLGWQGKHTNLVSRQLGSWTFLGAVFTTLALEPDAADGDHCGSCQACLDICPTEAFPAPYQLDARRCLSYLTIEHAGPIPREFRVAMGNRIYGCDDCLAVCPWNKWAQPTPHAALQPRAALDAPRLVDLARLDDAAFRALFSTTAVKRIGRDRFVRNVLIALGNSGAAAAVPVLRERLTDAAPLVRGAAVWALSRLLSGAALIQLKALHFEGESDAAVRAEWDTAALPNPTPLGFNAGVLPSGMKGAIMTIKVGDKIPDGTLMQMTESGPGPLPTADLFKGKKVAVFGLPGAFTPTCSAKHVPSYMANFDKLKAKGVDKIVCMSVNDAFVMSAWGKDQKVGDKIIMAADGSADLTKKLGLELDLTARGMGVRCTRFSMLVDDGVVKQINVEKGGAFEVSDAETMLKQL